MPQVDLSGTKEASDNQYPPLPDGWYMVKVGQVFERNSIKVGDYYGLELVVTHGSNEGRKIFDSMFFTPDAKPRLKLMLKRLGFDVEGMIHFTPSDLIGRTCQVNIITEESIYKGEKRKQNKVLFAGYDYYDADHSGDESAPVKTDDEEPLAF